MLNLAKGIFIWEDAFNALLYFLLHDPYLSHVKSLSSAASPDCEYFPPPSGERDIGDRQFIATREDRLSFYMNSPGCLTRNNTLET